MSVPLTSAIPLNPWTLDEDIKIVALGKLNNARYAAQGRTRFTPPWLTFLSAFPRRGQYDLQCRLAASKQLLAGAWKDPQRMARIVAGQAKAKEELKSKFPGLNIEVVKTEEGEQRPLVATS